jgi:hypothetical protein
MPMLISVLMIVLLFDFRSEPAGRRRAANPPQWAPAF